MHKTETAPGAKIIKDVEHSNPLLDGGGYLGRVKGRTTEIECFALCAKNDKCDVANFYSKETSKDNCALRELGTLRKA